MSFKQYRAIDLFIFIALYAGLEFLITKAATGWFADDSIYFVSLMLPLLLIVAMRWDKYVLIQAVISGVLFPIYLGKANIKTILIYVIGNLGFSLIVLLFKRIDKEKIRKNLSWSIVYVLLGYLLMELFRGLAAIIIEGLGPSVIISYFAEDALTLVFTLFVVLIARKIDGLFMDQKKYLLDLHKSEEPDNFGS